jgi:acetyl-CoA carboxylase carboxyltransferase component
VADRDLARLREARARAYGDKTARDLAPGALSPRDRVAALVDPGSFFELGLLATSQHEGIEGTTPADGVVTGFAQIGGREVAIVADDAAVLARTDGQVGKAKRRRMLKLALQEGLPMVLLLDQPSTEPPTFAPLSGALFGTLADQHDDPDLARRRGPLVTVLFAPPTGQTLELACESDIVVAVRASDPSGERGWRDADLFASDDTHAATVARATVEFFARGDAGVGPSPEPPSAPRVAQGSDGASQAIEQLSGLALLDHFADAGSVVELARPEACSLGTALVSIASSPFLVAVTGCSPARTLVADDIRRLRRLVALSHRSAVPLFIIQDCAGYSPTMLEDGEAAAHLADVVSGLRSASTPLVVLVVGDGHVLGTFCLGGRQLGPAFVLAWPWARVGVSDSRSYEADVLDRTRPDDPWLAAGLGLIDEVITPEESRPMLRWVARLLRQGRHLPPADESLRWYDRGSIKGV